MQGLGKLTLLILTATSSRYKTMQTYFSFAYPPEIILTERQGYMILLQASETLLPAFLDHSTVLLYLIVANLPVKSSCRRKRHVQYRRIPGSLFIMGASWDPRGIIARGVNLVQ